MLDELNFAEGEWWMMFSYSYPRWLTRIHHLMFSNSCSLLLDAFCKEGKMKEAEDELEIMMQQIISHIMWVLFRGEINKAKQVIDSMVEREPQVRYYQLWQLNKWILQEGKGGWSSGIFSMKFPVKVWSMMHVVILPWYMDYLAISRIWKFEDQINILLDGLCRIYNMIIGSLRGEGTKCLVTMWHTT